MHLRSCRIHVVALTRVAVLTAVAIGGTLHADLAGDVLLEEDDGVLDELAHSGLKYMSVGARDRMMTRWHEALGWH